MSVVASVTLTPPLMKGMMARKDLTMLQRDDDVMDRLPLTPSASLP